MRILILSASTGGGHKRAAQALQKYVEENEKTSQVKVIDALEEVGHLFNKTISEGYTFMAKNTPNFYGNVYNSSDKETVMNTAVTKISQQFAKKLAPYIRGYEPDVIISMHPFATTMISKLKEDKKVNSKLVAVLTDFSPHRTYINNFVDAYIVSSEEMKNQLKQYQIDEKIIYSVGIPIDPVFYEKYDKEALLSEMGFDSSKKTILIMAGSFGVTDILKIYQNISKIKKEFQIIVITGKNKKLYDSFEEMFNQSELKIKQARAKHIKLNSDSKFDSLLDEIVENIVKDKENELTKTLVDKNVEYKENRKKFKLKVNDSQAKIKDELLESTLIKKVYLNNKLIGITKPTKLLYFVNDVNKYMQVSDLIITKPGGLTVSESLASILPMAIFQAFPGQEAQNADFLVRNNMAVLLPKGEKCKSVIEQLIVNDDRLDEMKNACKEYNNPESAKNVFEVAKNLLGEL